MKTLMVVLMTVLLATIIQADSDWQAEPMESPGELRGTIAWSTKDGMLVEGAFKRRVLGNTIFPGPFFLTGFKETVVDGQALNVKAVPDGTYTYTTVLGASRTVKALRYSED